MASAIEMVKRRFGLITYIDRDAVSQVDLIWHFLTEPGWRLLLSVGSCHPCLQGQSLLEAISETRVKKATQSEKISFRF